MIADVPPPQLDSITLLDPWFLLLVPLALAIGVWRWRRPRPALPTAAIALFAGLPRTWRQRTQALPLCGKVLAACTLAIALARPVVREPVKNTTDGVDIVLVLDTSSSMLEQDMRGRSRYSRMDAARDRAAEFAAARVADRVALVTFARYAEVRCPPTLDERALGMFLQTVETVEPGPPLDGTAIGTALAKAVDVLRKSTAKSRVVVLLSDGETTVHDIEPMEAAKLAKDAGIRVHTIGLGRGDLGRRLGGGAPFGDLKAVSQHTGGEFFQPTSDAALADVYARIDELEKSSLEEPRYRYVDHFAWPLGIGLGVLLLTLLLEVLAYRRVP